MILETDSRTTLHLIEDATIQAGIYRAIVGQINQLRSEDWQVALQHIYREGNRLANYMVDLGQQ